MQCSSKNQEETVRAGIKELIRTEEDNTLSFGNYDLPTKGQVSDYVFDGDVYKVKTFHDITRLEKNETFAYESTPGTVVTDYKETEDTLSFIVNGFQDTQIIVAVEDDTEYQVSVDDAVIENYETNLSGKIVISLELEPGCVKKVQICKK